MKDTSKTKKQLLNEMNEMRQRISELENAGTQIGDGYKDLLDLLPVAVFEADAECNILYANHAATSITGYNNREFKEMNATQIIIPEDRVRLKENVTRSIGSEKMVPQEYWGRKKDGSIFRALVNSNIATRSHADFVSIRCTMIDITRQRQAEDSLKKTQKRYGKFVNNLPDGFLALDTNLRYTFWNKTCEKLTGIPAEYAIGKYLSEIFTETELDSKVSDRFRIALNTQQPDSFITEFKLADKNFVMEFHIYPSEDGLAVIAKDITGRKQAEGALQDISKRFKTFIESAPVGFLIFNPELVCIEVNQVALNMWPFRLNRDDVIGKNLTQLAPYITGKGIYERCLEVMRTGNPDFLNNFTLPPPSEDMHYSIKAFKSGDGLGVMVTDITKRRQAEELYETLANSSPVGVYIVQDRKFQFVNLRFQEYTGYTEDELLGKDPLTIAHPEDRELARDCAVAMLKGTRLSPYEFRAVSKDAKTIWAMETVTPIQYKGKRATLGNFINITEFKRIQEELERSYEHESELRSELEGMIDNQATLFQTLSHELKTPLTAIKSSAELLNEELSKEKQIHLERLINNIGRSTKRLEFMLNDLMELSKARSSIQQMRMYPTDINALIATVIDLYSSPIVQKNQSLVIDAPKNLPHVMADWDQLTYIFSNVIGNANKYTPEGGRISIRGWNENTRIIIEIKDTGPGIPKDEQKLIFRPFYRGESYRNDTMGKGIGLAIAREMTRSHGGDIRVVSKPGKGSTFTISLPTA